MASNKFAAKYSYGHCQKESDKEWKSFKEKVKSLKNIKEEEIQIERKSVSSGSFGDVSFGTYRGKNVVKKDFRYMATTNDRKYNYRETYTLATCKHQNIVTFIGAGPNTRMAEVRYVVIERASNASLAELIHSNVQYSIWHVMLWNLHLADGLEYLHSRPDPVIHRDLKPANMLLFDGCTILKISDFGCSKFFELGKEELQSVNQGSLLYMAPEVQPCRANENYTLYTEKVDIYSMTVSLWEMLTRKLDQRVNPQVMQICSCPPFLSRLITCGLSPKPDQRPSASELVQLLDFIMRKVCPKSTAQLWIDFESGQIPSLYQQSNTYPANSNTDPSYDYPPTEKTTVRFKASVSEVVCHGESLADGQESSHFTNLKRVDASLDLKEVPVLLRPVYPNPHSAAEMELYQRHVELVKEYVKLKEKLKDLKKQWDDRVTQIIAAKRISSLRVDEYKKRVKEYCELFATMQRYLQRAKQEGYSFA